MVTQSSVGESSDFEANTKTSISDAFGTWKLFRQSPWDLWLILIAKLIESFAFISEDLVFMMLLKEEILLTQQEAGTVYSITAGLTFLYGLVISGYLIDKGGVKFSLVLGSFFLTCARFLLTFAT